MTIFPLTSDPFREPFDNHQFSTQSTNTAYGETLASKEAMAPLAKYQCLDQGKSGNKNASGWLAIVAVRFQTSSPPSIYGARRTIEGAPWPVEEGTAPTASLRNTGELDLDNTSGRTCFFELVPSP